MASPHEVLGVDRDADRETIERRYRELVKEVHPDAGGSAEEFKRVKEAYRSIVNDAGTGGSVSRRDRSGSTSTGADRSSSDSSSGSSRRGRTGSSSGGDERSRRRSSYVGGGRNTTGSDRSGRRNSTSSNQSRRRNSSDTDRAGERDRSNAAGSSKSRRWVLYGFGTLLGAGALAQREGHLTTALDRISGEDSAEATGDSARSDTVSREVAPEDLFDVEFQASAGSTIHFTVDGADSSDWVNVYTDAEYERVAENWEGSGEFDPGEPVQTVLTEDGYVSELPEDGTYVVLVKLWSGPPDDPRDPRTVEVSYEIRS